MKKLIIKSIQYFFGTTEKVAPKLAQQLALKLFTKPFFPLKFTENDKKVLGDAIHETLPNNPSPIQSYTWGNPQNPKVLLMHGWNGKSMQFRDYISPLTKAGFCVVAIDAPGHGFSKAESSHILAFTEAILSAQKKFGDFEGIIAHSLGAVSSMYAIKQGLKVNTLVSISALTIAEEIYTSFAKKINIGNKTIQFLKDTILSKHKIKVNDLVAPSFINQLNSGTKDILVVHDKKDREVGFKHADLLTSGLKDADTYFTEGLGHARILKNEKVIEHITLYIVQKHKNKLI